MNSRKILRAAGLTLAGALGLWLFAAVLLPVLLPFLIGLAVAALVERPVAALLRRTRIPRGLASFLCVLAVYAALGTGLFFLCRTLLGELMGFLRRLPELAQTASAAAFAPASGACLKAARCSARRSMSGCFRLPPACSARRREYSCLS